MQLRECWAASEEEAMALIEADPWKLGQDEPRADVLAVATRLAASDSLKDQELSGWIRDKNV